MLNRYLASHIKLATSWIKQRSTIKKILLVLAGILVILVSISFGIAKWYSVQHNDEPVRLGATYIAPYAESLGLDSKQTMDALISDIGVRHFRLVSYWNQLEPEPDRYNFSLLDWQFEKAETSGSTITLSIGLRQPRWPECHMPKWAVNMTEKQWQQRLDKFIATTVNRYKDSPALISYQLENEFFLESFGHCTNFDEQRLVRESAIVKQLDPHRPIIMSRSNNIPVWPDNKPGADIVGVSVYRRVWEDKIINGYFNYPLPSWYYGFLAGVHQILHGQPGILHELQAEPWPPHGQTITETSLEEQNKTFDSGMLKSRVDFAKNTGLNDIYLWGAEYWYYRKVVLNEPAVWDEAKEVFIKANSSKP